MGRPHRPIPTRHRRPAISTWQFLGLFPPLVQPHSGPERCYRRVMSTSQVSNPALQLEGVVLEGGWTVGALIQRPPQSTGGTFCRKRPPGGRSVVYVSRSDRSNTFTFRCCRFSFCPACFTPFWSIKTPHRRKLFLLFCAKGKDGSTILAGNLFVSINH